MRGVVEGGEGVISPGEWYKLVPRDPVKNVEFRLALLKRAHGDKTFQQGMLAICRQDILFWINSFVWQSNPNKEVGREVGPFITWPFQDRALLKKRGILWHVENKRDAVVEKSRDMGATWIFMMVIDWLCRFHSYHDSLMMSKSAVAVDGPSRQSLFGKMRFIHEYLPGWMHDKEKFVDNKNYFGYPNHSTTTGFSSTAKAGVSERGSEMFFDEFSQVEEATEVYYRTAATSKCRLFNGTHMGLGTMFYALTQNEHIGKLQFHWTQHPDKNKGLYRWNKETNRVEFLRYNEDDDSITAARGPDILFDPEYEFDKTGNPVGGPHPGVRSPWYDFEFKRVNKNISEMSKDQDINPKGSVAQFYDPLMIRQLKEEFGMFPLWEGELEYDADHGKPLRFTAKEGGRLKLWVYLRNGMPPLGRYGAGTDISQGTGRTNSCLSIVDGRTGIKVLEYANPDIDPLEFASLCVALCRAFKDEEGNGAKLGWENHGPGTAFGKRVWKVLEYRNLYYMTAEHSIGSRVSDTPGWVPTKAAKLLLHTEYRMALYERRYLNRSESALDEALAFKHDGLGSVEHSQYKNKDDPSGAAENHGDMVIADALSCKMVIGDRNQDQTIIKEERELNEYSFAGRRAMRQQAEAEVW